MSKIREYGKVTFNDSWLEDERFKTWLNKSKDKHKAICILCNKQVLTSLRWEQVHLYLMQVVQSIRND